MRAAWLGSLLIGGLVAGTAACLAAFAQTQTYTYEAPKVTPGAYSVSYTCPDGTGGTVDFYVLDQFKLNNRRYYQQVRGEMAGGSFVGEILSAGWKPPIPRISLQQKEKLPTDGWAGLPYSFDFDGPIEQMVGHAFNGKECPMRPRANPNLKSVTDMGYPAGSEEPDHRLHIEGIPEGYRQILLDSAVSQPFTSRLVEAITADSDNWKFYRLTQNTFGDFHFFDQPDNAHEAWVWAGYRYLDENKIDLMGWATGQFIDGDLKCIKFHDKKRCTTPRPSYAQQLASLGAGKPKLGPMDVPSTCFGQQQRMVASTRDVVVYADRKGDIDTKKVTDFTPIWVEVYTCPERRSFKLECLAEGADVLTEWLTGLGSTRYHSVDLAEGSDRFTDGAIRNYNRRIGEGTCVRTQ